MLLAECKENQSIMYNELGLVLSLSNVIANVRNICTSLTNTLDTAMAISVQPLLLQGYIALRVGCISILQLQYVVIVIHKTKLFLFGILQQSVPEPVQVNARRVLELISPQPAPAEW